MTGTLFDVEPHGTPCMVCGEVACVCRAGGSLDATLSAWPIGGELVHRHARRGPCRTVCGRPCDVGRVAYAGDSERVTCPACLSGETFDHAAGASAPFPR